MLVRVWLFGGCETKLHLQIRARPAPEVFEELLAAIRDDVHWKTSSDFVFKFIWLGYFEPKNGFSCNKNV